MRDDRHVADICRLVHELTDLVHVSFDFYLLTADLQFWWWYLFDCEAVKGIMLACGFELVAKWHEGV